MSIKHQNIAIAVSFFLILGFAVYKIENTSPPPLTNKWYGEYCRANSDWCEYRDGEGDTCPVQLNNRDAVTSINLRLKDNSCVVQGDNES